MAVLLVVWCARPDAGLFDARGCRVGVPRSAGSGQPVRRSGRAVGPVGETTGPCRWRSVADGGARTRPTACAAAVATVRVDMAGCAGVLPGGVGWATSPA